MGLFSKPASDEGNHFDWMRDFGNPDEMVDALGAQRTLEVVGAPCDVQDVGDASSWATLAGARRIGILGGTFDPIHIGHLAFAEAARESLNLDCVLLMPASVPVYKLDQYVTPAADRFEMCRLAAQNNPWFEASDIELHREGNTYTSDTLNEMADALPDAEFYFFVGADAAITVPKWHNSSEIARLATLVVACRPGTDLDGAELVEQIGAPFRVEIVNCPELDISSSAIRKSIGEGKSVRYLVPDAVYDYIIEHELYR